MDYDRVRVKQMARGVLRRARPRPWLVTLVYTLLTTLPGVAVSFVTSVPQTLAGSLSYAGRYGAAAADGALVLISLFASVLVGLLTAVLSTGYAYYAMNLWRGRRTDFQDLFHGLSLAGKVIPLYLLMGVFCALWGLACMVVYLPALAVGLLLESEAALYAALTLCTIAYLALLLNRTLRYALAYYILLDHPSWGAMDCLNASKDLMQGRRWSLCVLELSFLGWYLLLTAILLVVMVVVFGAAFLLATALLPNYGVGAAALVLLLALLGALLLGSLCTLPLTLWLTPYLNVAAVGFYDCAAGYGYPQPAPPPAPEPPAHYRYQSRDVAPRPPAAPGTVSPPREEPSASRYYSGFIRPEAPPAPEEDQEPKE